MDSDDLISLLGKTSDDENVKLFLSSFEINKVPKLKKGDYDTYLLKKKKGLEITFTDERFLDVQRGEYEEGSLVLSNLRMYGGGESDFKKFTGPLPHGLSFEFGKKEVFMMLKKKPAWQGKDSSEARWDFSEHCLFVTFDEQNELLKIVDVQLPIE